MPEVKKTETGFFGLTRKLTLIWRNNCPRLQLIPGRPMVNTIPGRAERLETNSQKHEKSGQ